MARAGAAKRRSTEPWPEVRENDIQIPMRDGGIIRARVYSPSESLTARKPWLSLRLVVAMFWGVLKLRKRTAGRRRRDVVEWRSVSGTGMLRILFIASDSTKLVEELHLSIHGRGQLKMYLMP
jgi:predicted acyl esterase